MIELDQLQKVIESRKNALTIKLKIDTEVSNAKYEMLMEFQLQLDGLAEAIQRDKEKA